MPHVLDYRVLTTLPRDGPFLFITRCVRLFGYGLISVILGLYLARIGIPDFKIGLLISLTLVGDMAISLPITTSADRLGRKKMLIIGALLVLAAGIVFGLTTNYWLLLAAATIGVISPSGNEVGPFLSIEQASLSQIVPGDQRTAVFAWYNLVGSVSTAVGAFVGGFAVDFLQRRGWSPLDSFRFVIYGYAALGLLLAFLFLFVSRAVEPPPVLRAVDTPRIFGLHKSRHIVFQLSALFALDAFAGGFVIQALMAFWFYKTFGMSYTALGAIFCGANIMAGISALSAASLARRIGLIETMVYTHIPSNILLILVPLMPNLPLAITMLLLRFSISQMDVPTRQSYTMAVVDPDERSAASGITAVARSAGAAVSPSLAWSLVAIPALISVPFFLSGSLKIVYDILLYRSFKSHRPPEEQPAATHPTIATPSKTHSG